MRIYVASSWRNERYMDVVRVLRDEGHEVFDFREQGFHWAEVDPDYDMVKDPGRVREMLAHPLAVEKFQLDMKALGESEAVVLVQPCGNDAHIELGWAIAGGKHVFILQSSGAPVGLMYGLVPTSNMTELLADLVERVNRAAEEEPCLDCLPQEEVEFEGGLR